jgi:hypothetical protein
MIRTSEKKRTNSSPVDLMFTTDLICLRVRSKPASHDKEPPFGVHQLAPYLPIGKKGDDSDVIIKTKRHLNVLLRSRDRCANL